MYVQEKGVFIKQERQELYFGIQEILGNAIEKKGGCLTFRVITKKFWSACVFGCLVKQNICGFWTLVIGQLLSKVESEFLFMGNFSKFSKINTHREFALKIAVTFQV